MLLRLRFIVHVSLTSISVSCATVAFLFSVFFIFYLCILHIQYKSMACTPPNYAL